MSDGPLRIAVADAAAMDWTEFHPAVALACVPMLALILGGGLVLGWSQPALAASTGALAAGFGFFQRVSNRRTTVMLLVTLGMSLSAGIGTLANAAWPVETGCIVVWGFVLGLAAMVSQPLYWVVLQCAIALVVAAAIPAGLPEAGYRTLLVGAGGILQTVALGLLAAIFPALEAAIQRPGVEVAALRTGLLVRALRQVLSGHATGIRFPCVVAAAAGLASLLFHLTEMPNGYWMAMTAMLILRPVVRETRSRAVARLAGTAVGACVVTLLMALLRPSQPILAALIIVAAWGCFASQRVNYALLTVCVTGYVALLFAYAGLPEPIVALHRLEATALGGVLALIVHSIGIWLWERTHGPDQNGPDQNGDGGPFVMPATSARQTSAPKAAARNPSL